MTNNQTVCDRDRIQQFLEQKLTDADLSAFEGHLNDCDDCRRQLETAVASEDIWSEMRDRSAGLSRFWASPCAAGWRKWDCPLCRRCTAIGRFRFVRCRRRLLQPGHDLEAAGPHGRRPLAWPLGDVRSRRRRRHGRDGRRAESVRRRLEPLCGDQNPRPAPGQRRGRQEDALPRGPGVCRRGPRQRDRNLRRVGGSGCLTWSCPTSAGRRCSGG